ncbi:MAG: orotidine-5'-phosphate decarboxylase, partial [Pirellulaceae bacterium]|nr:orotidine-5'-phosphate decarboxylase [Pirellulaceae bacterium]
MESEHFGDRLAERVKQRGNPVLVGLDPRWRQLPSGVRGNDESPSGQASAYEAFCQGVIDVVAPLVAAVKPQMAFFEQLGPPGLTALESVVRYARSHGLLVILDGKRNDIGSTATA